MFLFIFDDSQTDFGGNDDDDDADLLAELAALNGEVPPPKKAGSKGKKRPSTNHAPVSSNKKAKPSAADAADFDIADIAGLGKSTNLFYL